MANLNVINLETGDVASVPAPDFLVQHEGTIAVLFAITEEAEQWALNNLPGDAQQWAGGTVIEHRFVDDILFGIHNDGLTFEVR